MTVHTILIGAVAVALCRGQLLLAIALLIVLLAMMYDGRS